MMHSGSVSGVQMSYFLSLLFVKLQLNRNWWGNVKKWRYFLGKNFKSKSEILFFLEVKNFSSRERERWCDSRNFNRVGFGCFLYLDRTWNVFFFGCFLGPPRDILNQTGWTVGGFRALLCHVLLISSSWFSLTFADAPASSRSPAPSRCLFRVNVCSKYF